MEGPLATRVQEAGGQDCQVLAFYFSPVCKVETQGRCLPAPQSPEGLQQWSRALWSSSGCPRRVLHALQSRQNSEWRRERNLHLVTLL